jgi:hypothetical protein
MPKPRKLTKTKAKKYFCYSLEMDRKTGAILLSNLRAYFFDTYWDIDEGADRDDGDAYYLYKIIQALTAIPKLQSAEYPHAKCRSRRARR